MERNPVEHLSQNADLKAAWTRTGSASIFGAGAPFHDAAARNGKKIVYRPSAPTVRICIPMVVRGKCYSNCIGFHGPLTQAECTLVAQERGFAL